MEIFSIISGIFTGLLIVTIIILEFLVPYDTPTKREVFNTASNLLFFLSPLAIVTGVLAIWRIKKSNKNGLVLAFLAILLAAMFPLFAFLLVTLLAGYGGAAVIGFSIWIGGLIFLVKWCRT